MKILVLGGSGMLGHELVWRLSRAHDVAATLRDEAISHPFFKRCGTAELIAGVDVRRFETVDAALSSSRPDAIVNAVGVVKQLIQPGREREVREINSEFPHKLAQTCRDLGIRLLHVSTDCVFSGTRGNYSETDPADAVDLYGSSKLSGEVSGDACITLRTSIIGLELSRRLGLVEWFLRQKESIRGYRRAIFSGFTTCEFARIIERILVDHRDKAGLYHVSSQPIDKFMLLSTLRDHLGRDIAIRPFDGFECDRSLDSSRFRSEFDYTPPSWDDMLMELSDRIRERES